MFSGLSRATFSMLAESAVAKKLASRYGLKHPHSVARRFVAGESLEDALQAARTLEQQGLMVTIDRLGELVTEREAASSATRAVIALIRAEAGAGISKNVSVKLTQLGLEIDRSTAIDNLRRILDAAAAVDCFVRIDMEGSEYTDVTLDAFEGLWNIGCRNLGVVIQAYLRRSENDLKRVIALGSRVRLVKGAYREPKDVAFQEEAEVHAEFLRLMRILLAEGTYPAIATHDPEAIEETKRFATSRGLAAGAFEFQLLYGIRRDLQASLAAQGYPVRIYVPYGDEWFPYFMRRLAERPENVSFVIRGILGERKDRET
jgi:proline dehydrogenase